jgi:hypothetical protein
MTNVRSVNCKAITANNATYGSGRTNANVL